MTPEILGGCLEQQNGMKRMFRAWLEIRDRFGKSVSSSAALRGLGLPAPHNGNGGLDEQRILYRTLARGSRYVEYQR